MNKYDIIQYNINPQPIPSVFNEGYSQYETLSKLLYLVNQYIENMNTGADEIEELKAQKVSLEYYLNDLANNRKLSTTGDFTGTLNGMPIVQEQTGLSTTVAFHTNEISSIKSDINSLAFYPRLNGETNDYARLLRAIDLTPVGGLLQIPVGVYDMNGNDIDIVKEISIVGESNTKTIISNGGFSIESSNVEIHNLCVSCPNLDNGFQINQTSVSNVFISNCKSMGRDHGFLIESYNGTVQDITIENCITENSIHGFIAKAVNVRFINCKAKTHTGFGYAFISDNIPSSTQVANCISSKILNCETDNCGTSFYSYCRDKWNAVCVPRCNNNSVDGLTISNSANPFVIGEESIPVDYLSIYRIDFMVVNNVRVINPNQSVWCMSLRNCYRCVIDNCILPYKLEQKTTSAECIIGNVVVETSRPHTKPITLGSTGSSGTIDVSLNNVFEVMISGNATDKILFSGLPKNGTTITVIVRSTGSTTFAGFDTSNTKLVGNTISASFAFNHGQITEWMWSPGLSKFVCIKSSGDLDLT